MRREVITWQEVEKLIDHLIPQFPVEFDAIVMLRQGGIVPGGMLAEMLRVKRTYIADIEFPKGFELERQRSDPKFVAWPVVHVFPEASLIADRKVLVVTSAWGTGRIVPTVRNKVTGADGEVYTCVLHFSHQRSLFTNEKPDFYAALTDAWIIYPWEIERGTDLIMKDLV